MSECTIVTTGLISNQTPMPSDNPHECHSFTHQVAATTTGNFISHVAWSISGEFPNDLTIDTGSGLLSGVMLILDDQPSSIVTDIAPIETPNLDNSNFINNGRPLSDSYTFPFTIKRDYIIKISDNPLVTAPESTTSICEILLIKDFNIDTILAMRNYLEAGYTTVKDGSDDIDVTHKLWIGDKAYTNENLDEYLNDTPIIIPTCAKE